MRWLSVVVPLVATLAACKSPDDPSASSTEESTTTATTAEAETDTGTSTETETGDEMPACPAQTPAELMDCVDQARFEADLEFVSAERVPGSPHWQAVQDLCADRLTELGYEVTREDYGTGINVVGVREGSEMPNEWVIVGGHYDHIPSCSGADDNGTGIAATLEVARILADVPTPRTLVITCWDEEELGLIGSAAQAEALIASGQAIAGVFSLDSIGASSSEPNSQVVPEGFDLLFPEQYGELEDNEFRGEFLLWVSDDAMMPIGDSLDGFADSVGLWTLGTSLDDVLKNAEILSDLRRSDHASFWAVDIPAMFLNDTGEFRYSAYHCQDGTDDTIDKVNIDFVIKVTKVAVASAAVALGM